MVLLVVRMVMSAVLPLNVGSKLKRHSIRAFFALSAFGLLELVVNCAPLRCAPYAPCGPRRRQFGDYGCHSWTDLLGLGRKRDICRLGSRGPRAQVALGVLRCPGK